MKELNIEVYGGLKEHFPKKFSIQHPLKSSVADVLSHLTELKPEAKKILSQCIVAVENKIYQKSNSIEGVDLLVLMPPYSGG